MAITASRVRELRERTLAGMMECKKALVESNGDIEAAIQAMRKSGQLKAAKRSGRTAAEGVIIIHKPEGVNQAAMVEVNCETDFVARDENFKVFANQVAESAYANQSQDAETLKAAAYSSEGPETIEQTREALVAKLGENINVRRSTFVEEGEFLGAYVHSGRIGVIAVLKGGSEDLAKDIAMHIAASNPTVVSPSDVPEALIEKEKEIFAAQAQESGKPAEIIEKMIGGRITKYLDEISLLGQSFVKDPSKKVSSLLQSENAEVLNFIRFEVGEGIEKKQQDFAEEVMAQVRES